MPGDAFLNRILRDYGLSESILDETRSILYDTLRESDEFPYGLQADLKQRVSSSKGETIVYKLACDIRTLISVLDGDDYSQMKDLISSSRSRSSSQVRISQKQYPSTPSTCTCSQDVIILKDTVTSLQAEMLNA